MTNTILVIGSTGKTGKRVADQLETRGIPVRAPRDFGAYARDAAATCVWTP